MQKASEASRLLSEALTRRELTILLHLSNGKSSHEIALLESLAYTSVKWYIHQVYGKLGVNSRRDALVRAKELALLSKGPVAALHPPAAGNNLPRQFTSFIGREKEIQQILDLVHTYPIVTLTGSGGTGKTRLALHAVEKAIEDFPDGAWFVDLASLDDPAWCHWSPRLRWESMTYRVNPRYVS
jgi:DNA-binding CsgD family transcriptional regulator